MEKISEKEKQKNKKYFLDLAKNLEKSGFEYFAANIYRHPENNRKKANKIYIKLAKKAEKKRLLDSAAELYDSAGESKKAREIWKKHAVELKRKGLYVIAKEALQRSKIRKIAKKLQKLVSKARELERQGRFKESIIYFEKAAKHEEKKKNFRSALFFYRDAFDLKNAERCWKLVNS